MNNRKEYGNYTLGQLQQYADLIHSLPVLKEIWHGLLSDKAAILENKRTPHINWTTNYAHPLFKQTDSAIHHLNMGQQIAEFHNSSDPQQAAIDATLHEFESINSDLDGLEPQIEPTEAIGIVLALIKTIESIMHYGLSLNDLVKIASRGNDKALFRAVRIDRTIVSCPPIADRITLAEIQEDKKFFRKLRNALKGQPNKTKIEYGPLRCLLHQLEDDGQLATMTRKERCDLFCEKLGLYPSDDNDAEKSLDTFIRRWKKEKST
jgi:hypothetical protein